MFNVEDMDTSDGVLVFTVLPFLIGLFLAFTTETIELEMTPAFIFMGWFIYAVLSEL